MEQLTKLIRDDMKPALGVTEPGAIAFAVSKARSYVGGKLDRVELTLNSGMYKNAFTCGIPGSRFCGNEYAAALGVLAGKPEKVINGAIMGRLNKQLKEICLLDQVYVKAEDGKQSVAAYVAQVAKANGANVTVKGFVRFETGEGMEKKNEDFAAEVAAQLG